MRSFAHLLDRLSLTYARNSKLTLLAHYFKNTPDPDRGYALGILTGAIEFKSVKASQLKALIKQKTDPYLFDLSYDYVGDMAETISLLWPQEVDASVSLPDLSQIVETVQSLSKQKALSYVEQVFNSGDQAMRWALIKILTGGLRIGVSARLAKLALAQAFDKDIQEIEEIWHAEGPPYATFFKWLEGGQKPDVSKLAVFHPLMLANPLEEGDYVKITPDSYLAEWKWDGIRVQLNAQQTDKGRDVRLYSRTGDDISHAFPDILDAVDFQGVFDGELLVIKEGQVQPFNQLQQRLNRKTVSKKMLQDYPAGLYMYDLLFDEAQDWRTQPLVQRRQRLEEVYAQHMRVERFFISERIEFERFEELQALRDEARALNLEGLMLKDKNSVYVPGRPKGPWYKWKRDVLLVDAVMMYAQRGHGKRSSFYSDYTFGAWLDDTTLVPIGKAYSGFTDADLVRLDKFVRDHTTNRFGPVREVAPHLVLEIAFDSIHASKRHKSGVAMRFPRIHRIRWDKPAAEADTLEAVKKLMEGDSDV